MADDFEEASLDDFFQPPAEEEAAAASQPAAAPAPAGDDPFAATIEAPEAPAAPAPQVEELPITDLGPGGADRKKILIIAGAVVGVLLLLGAAYFLFFGSEEPAPPPPRRVAATTPPPVPAAPSPVPAQLALSRLTDLDRSPSTPHARASTLYDVSAKGLSAPGKKKLSALASPLSFYLGTFVVPPHLESAKGKVRSAGLTPIVREGRASVQMHRLHVASHESRRAAERDKAKLKRAGFDAFVIKESRVSYQVYAGSFFTQEKAREYQDRLFESGSGFVGELTTVRVKLPVWELWAGSYGNPDDLQKPLSKLLLKGVEFDVVASG